MCGVCQPDIILSNQKIAIFCDGDYWHNLPRMVASDKKKEKYAQHRGFDLVIIWHSEIKKNGIDEMYRQRVQPLLWNIDDLIVYCGY